MHPSPATQTALPTEPAQESPIKSGCPDSSSPPRTFTHVWYRTPEKRGFAAFLASGTLTVGADAVIFESKKINLTIPTASIWRVATYELANDTMHNWNVVEYDEGGLLKGAGFVDPRMSPRNEDAAIIKELRLAAAWGRCEPASVWNERPLGTTTDGRTEEGLVEMRHYSFKMPSNGNWGIEKPGGAWEETVLTEHG